MLGTLIALHALQTGNVIRIDQLRRTPGPIILKDLSDVTIKGKGTLSGLVELKGFRIAPNGHWKLEIPGVKTGWNFSQLFANGQRRLRPRSVRNGYSHIAGRVEPRPKFAAKGSDGFAFSPGDLNPNWANLEDVEVLTWLEWGITRSRIEAFEGDVVRFNNTNGINDIWARYKETYRFFAENVKENLTNAGEWYLDRPTGELTYIPMPGESLKNTKIEVPLAPNLIVIQNCKRIKIEGLNLEGSNYNTPTNGRYFYQAEADLGAAIEIENSSEIDIKNCTIRRIGEYAIKVSQQSNNIRIEDCRMTDLGGGGVLIGEMSKPQSDDTATHHVTVKDCVIYGYGRIHPASIGIWLGQTPFNTIEGNWIEDGYYTGVSAGWSWGYGKSGSHHNIIRNNDIRNIGQKVLSDMGGIYTLSPSPGTRIEGNRISDVESYSYGGWGIYTDEGSTNIEIRNNVTWKTTNGGFHQHYGKMNLIENNIFAFGRDAQMQYTRAEPHQSFTVKNNIFVSDGGPLFGNYGWNDGKYAFSGNTYWRTDGKPLDWAGMDIAKWKQKSGESSLSIADPQLSNAAKEDFSVKPTSPALALGFQNHPRLRPSRRPSGLPSVPRTFPVPTQFNPPIWK